MTKQAALRSLALSGRASAGHHAAACPPASTTRANDSLCPQFRINMPVKLTTAGFIVKARAVHGEKYDYSRVAYVNSQAEVEIICSIHGEFKQVAASHIRGHGCIQCQNKNNSLGLAEFILKANAVHNDSYDYSTTVYVNARTKLSIRCPNHGEFSKRPRGHLQGQGCPKCGFMSRNEKHSIGLNKFLERAKSTHGSIYDYSHTKYLGIESKVTIACPVHGSFDQAPHQHVRGQGCPKCGIIKSNRNKNSQGCWSATTWSNIQNGRKAILYVIELTNEDELFYKVGITFNLSARFGSRKMPYSWRTVALYKTYDAKYVFKLEKEIFKEFKHLKYSPLSSFAGQTECFSAVAEILVTLPPDTFFLKNRPVK